MEVYQDFHLQTLSVLRSNAIIRPTVRQQIPALIRIRCPEHISAWRLDSLPGPDTSICCKDPQFSQTSTRSERKLRIENASDLITSSLQMGLCPKVVCFSERSPNRTTQSAKLSAVE